MQQCLEDDENEAVENMRDLELEDGSQRLPQWVAEYKVQRIMGKGVRRVGGGLYPIRSSLHPYDKK